MTILAHCASHGLRATLSRCLASLVFQCGLLFALLAGMGSVHAATVAHMATGAANSAAVLSDGTLWAWGDNKYGQLGNGSTVSADRPVQIGSGFAKVAVGGTYMVGLKTDGTLWMWGSVQLKNQTLNETRPVQVGSGFARLMTSDTASKADGAIWYWGHMKELIKASVASDDMLDRLPPGYVQMHNNRNSVLFMLGDGAIQFLFVPWDNSAVVGMGSWMNGYGSTGPVDRGFVQLALGMVSAAGVKEDGTLWQWGGIDAPVLVGGGYRQVAKGSGHTLALKTDGTAWAWGASNYWGELGNGTRTESVSPQSLGGGYAQVAAAGAHSLALTTNGLLLAWGRNDSGQLGVGQAGQVQLSPLPVVFEGAAAPGLGSMVATGTLTRLTLSAHVRIQPEHLGAQGHPYLVAVTPDGTMFTYSAPNFERLNPANPLAWADRLQHTSSTLFANQDMRHLSGTAFFIGYGLGATTAESLGDMLNSYRYQRVYDMQ